MLTFDIPENESSIIKVIGVGGGGGNAVNFMFEQNIEGVDFIVCNTDQKALAKSPVPHKIQLGPNLTQGLGAGADPKKGKSATEESLDVIRKILENNTKMVFITAGMGGGTGTGGAPIIAKLCRDLGILTVGIVTKPFKFEGPRREEFAKDGIQELMPFVDTLLVISNEKLREKYGNFKMSQAYSKADNILAVATRCITDIIHSKGHIIVDFADVCTVMRDGGHAIMGKAEAEGEDRALRAVEEALNSPLLDDNDISGARWLLINISSSSGESEITMEEVELINNYVRKHSGLKSDVIFGQGIDETLGNKIAVTVIATGFPVKKTNNNPSIQSDKPSSFEQNGFRSPIDLEDLMPTRSNPNSNNSVKNSNDNVMVLGIADQVEILQSNNDITNLNNSSYLDFKLIDTDSETNYQPNINPIEDITEINIETENSSDPILNFTVRENSAPTESAQVAPQENQLITKEQSSLVVPNFNETTVVENITSSDSTKILPNGDESEIVIKWDIDETELQTELPTELQSEPTMFSPTLPRQIIQNNVVETLPTNNDKNNEPISAVVIEEAPEMIVVEEFHSNDFNKNIVSTPKEEAIDDEEERFLPFDYKNNTQVKQELNVIPIIKTVNDEEKYQVSQGIDDIDFQPKIAATDYDYNTEDSTLETNVDPSYSWDDIHDFLNPQRNNNSSIGIRNIRKKTQMTSKVYLNKPNSNKNSFFSFNKTKNYDSLDSHGSDNSNGNLMQNRSDIHINSDKKHTIGERLISKNFEDIKLRGKDGASLLLPD